MKCCSLYFGNIIKFQHGNSSSVFFVLWPLRSFFYNSRFAILVHLVDGTELSVKGWYIQLLIASYCI